jgi:putative transposase
MKSESHHWASLNYVFHNAVRHGYVERWQDWPYSNAADYLEEVGRVVAERRWREYPVDEYGKDWDPPEM